MYKGAIFDLDGTLLDSMNVWRKIDIDFLGKRGFEVPDDYPISARDQEVMDEDPKERAERDLSWGFSLVKRLEIGQTEKQNAFVEEMISRIGS